MLVEKWSNNQYPIVHPNLTTQAQALEYVKACIKQFKQQELYDWGQEFDNGYIVYLFNGTHVEYREAVVRK